MTESQSEKLHAACDECRTRKLKCSGHHPTCSRCEREKIQCFYSPQKQMGRPRKRRRDITTEQAEPLDQIRAIESGVYQSPAIVSFEISAFKELTIPPSFEVFTGLEDFETNGRSISASLPPPHTETTINNGFGYEDTQTTNFDPNATHTAIDPSLLNDRQKHHTPHLPININEPTIPSPQPNPNIGPCTCFSLMYLTVSDLHSMTNFSFPAIVPRLRNAAKTAQTIIRCTVCPLSPFSAIQNVQSVNSILSSLAERYHKVLMEIEAEAARLEAIDQKKLFCFGDSSSENTHLHTGAIDCPMRFNIELPPKDWKRLCKTALKQEVHGGGHAPIPLVKLLDEFSERQIKWHNDKDRISEAREKMFGPQDGCKDADSCIGLRMLTQIRTMIENMEWDD